MSPRVDRPRRGRPRLDDGPALDRHRLIAVLMDIARAEGLEALNMRRVAGDLGVSPRLLYHHVHDKEDMVALLADEITGSTMPDLSQGNWDDRLRAVNAATQRAFREYRGIPANILSKALRTHNRVHGTRMREGVLQALRDAGLNAEQVEIAFVQFSIITLGSLVLHENLSDADGHLAIPAERVEHGIDLGLDLLIFGIKRLADGQSLLPVRDQGLD
ncbi:TetR/AcrR family transcriptional regulator [Sphingobium sp. TCM1]|uniref:TetR/AcrR family transcriptional regulator n=1 Tax=Sphingobium sp. TCM1 TaxID=453246 RepID=UPI0007F4F67F|nr:TetR family transcriptional regulator [Sphingobium sp. TCM1]OAN56221.1 hypothetical protein A7Q26_02085 [Sphingobium sp. TCM1]